MVTVIQDGVYLNFLGTDFDNIALDEMGKPTEAAITTLRAELECTARATQTRAPSQTVVQKVRAATLSLHAAHGRFAAPLGQQGWLIAAVQHPPPLVPDRAPNCPPPLRLQRSSTRPCLSEFSVCTHGS